MKLNIKIVSLFLLFISSITVLTAQVELYPSGYITHADYVTWGADDPLDAAVIMGSVNLDGTILDAQFRLSLELYSNIAGIMDDTDYSDYWYYPAAYEGIFNDRTMFSADLKEAWLGFALGDFDLNIGKQILTWGQADGTNPTDNINPKYIGTRSVSGSMEKKMGVLMANIVYYMPILDGNIQGVFMPLASSNDMPISEDYIEIEEPDIAIENMEGGIRALVYPGSVSLSASYLTILDRYPTDAMETMVMPPSFTYSIPTVLGYNRQHIIGFDAVWLVGGFDLRTEWAYTITDDTHGTDVYSQNPFLNGVVQGSRSFFDGTTSVSLSWAPKYITNFEDPYIPESMPFLSNLYMGQGYEWENMVGIRIQSKFLNETLQPEAMFLAALSAKDHLTTAGVSYNLADGWNLKLGVSLYGSFLEESDTDRQLGVFGNDNMIDSDSIYFQIRLDL
ncbi:MAG: hypothetical protein OCD02_12725 [Spirochaetaceae bacterium]